MNTAGKTIVVKIGTSTLVDESGAIDRDYLFSVAEQLRDIRRSGWRPIVVTSAAIAAGLQVLAIKQRPTDMPSLQAAASVGQSALSTAYAEEFARCDMVTGAVLLTRHDTASRHAYLHARDTLQRLLELDVIPIVNENDTVSVEQIRFGDNDTLAALVACLVKADSCVIFSDIDGMYDKNPNVCSDAKLMSTVEKVTPDILSAAGGAGSTVGSGGMMTKVKAARVLMVAGIALVICHGRTPDALSRICAGESVGTRFCETAKPHEITPYKLWVALGDSPNGSVVLDDGARKALVEKGSSLLSVGVVEVRGSFDAGDIVDVVDSNGYIFARGKVAASSDAAKLACGRSQSDLAQNSLLCALADHPLIHRDEMVVFE